ncbi:MAG: pantoate--beta-alanine ligase [Pseudomonadota bacterium]
MAEENSKASFISALPELRAEVRQWRQSGQTVALVPTMGSLHEGHLSLVRTAKTRCDRVVTSIFVNPAQFALDEDFGMYPRTFDADLEKLASVDCDLVWAPSAEVMYPGGFATTIALQGAAVGLETDFRPHFFAGVATVCCKLFAQVQPDIALFGEKDYQQLCVVRQMVRDLNLPLDIAACGTVRETDGLAMSSRNAYLSDKERAIAPSLHCILQDAARSFHFGRSAHEVCKAAVKALEQAGFNAVDYVAIRDAETLQPVTNSSGMPCRLLAAGWLGRTRLIDNIPC